MISSEWIARERTVRAPKALQRAAAWPRDCAPPRRVLRRAGPRVRPSSAYANTRWPPERRSTRCAALAALRPHAHEPAPPRERVMTGVAHRRRIDDTRTHGERPADEPRRILGFRASKVRLVRAKKPESEWLWLALAPGLIGTRDAVHVLIAHGKMEPFPFGAFPTPSRNARACRNSYLGSGPPPSFTVQVRNWVEVRDGGGSRTTVACK
jgi:hypothetical protein